jgi:hypothetical protein
MMVKPGFRTTELYAVVAAALANAAKVVPPTRGIVIAALAAVYALARGLAKHGKIDVDALDAELDDDEAIDATLPQPTGGAVGPPAGPLSVGLVEPGPQGQPAAGGAPGAP